MRIVPDIKATFGDTYFLGYSEKKKFDRSTGKNADEIEGYICKLSSSELQEQIDVIVPITVDIQSIKFNQKVLLQGVEFNPYGKTSKDSTFAEVKLRCTAKAILDESISKSATNRNEALK